MLYPHYFTYIVQCADGSFYVGQTNNLKRRLMQHNGILRGGARYTLAKKPVVLRYYEEYVTRGFAMHREYELKKLTHMAKEKLITS